MVYAESYAKSYAGGVTRAVYAKPYADSVRKALRSGSDNGGSDHGGVLRKVLHKRLTQSLTQASYARIWIFFYLLKPYASLTQDPYADAVYYIGVLDLCIHIRERHTRIFFRWIFF